MLETHVDIVHGVTKNFFEAVGIRGIHKQPTAKAIQPVAHCSTVVCNTIVTDRFSKGVEELILLIQM